MILVVQLPSRRRGPRVVPMVGSLAAHAVILAWIAAPAIPGRYPSAYKQLIKPQEEHLVWYSFKRDLPEVKPRNRAADNRPLKAETKLERQSIVSAPENAPKSPQMIFHPVPQIETAPLQPLPNLIALSAPPPAPAPPAREKFIPPPARQPKAPTATTRDAGPAPELAMRLDTPGVSFDMPRVTAPYVPPKERKRELTARIQTADAPEIDSKVSAIGTNSNQAIEAGARAFALRPLAKRSVTAGVGNMPNAPALDGASQSTANVAVVGLNAIDKLDVPLPAGSRKAQFSGGPKLNPNGATSSGISSGITVPDLTVRGGEGRPEPTLIARTVSPAYPSPTSPESLREVARQSAGLNKPSTPQRMVGTPVSGAPDPRFYGRQVFSMAIQAPNLTSHSGSWLMWYADRDIEDREGTISAPQPLHKVDPRYIATAVEEHIQGTVRLLFVIGRDGRVYEVERVKGIDPRLDRSAIDALRKWEFAPATRNGEPIDVEALVDIPFLLMSKETQ